MEVRKRKGSPFWMADFVHPGTGERARVSTKVLIGDGPVAERRSLRVAEARGREIVDELAALAVEERDGKARITLQDALDNYIASRLAAGKRSAVRAMPQLRDKVLGQTAGGRARFHLDPNMRMAQLTPQLLERLRLARAAEGNGPQTIAHELKLIRAAHHYCKALDYKVADIAKWQLPVAPRKTRYLSWEEWTRVYDYLAPDKVLTQTRGSHKARPYAPAPSVVAQRQDVQDLLVALTLCGGRWSEVATLRWSQVDTVEWATITLFGTKGGGKERIVGLPKQLADALRRRWEGRTGPLIFPGRVGAGRRVCAPRSISKALDVTGCNTPELVERHGRATVHSLRHTYASWLLQNDAGLAEVQDALGHTTMHMTLRYAHLSKAKTAARLGGILSNMIEQQGAAA